MQIGDPRKAVVLAVIAFVILSLAAIRIIPRGPGQLPAEVVRAQDAQASDVQKETVSSLPSTLTSQPFAKPRASVSLPPTQLKGPRALGTSRATGPGAEQAPLGSIEMGSHAPLLPNPSNPSEITGSNRQVNKDVKLTVTLNGTVSVTRRIAIVTVSNHSEKPMKCEVGSKIDGYEVIAIDDSDIVIEKGTQRVELTVGTTKPL